MGKRGLAVALSLILLGGSIGTAAPGVQARKTEKVTVKNPEITSLALKRGEKFQLKTKGNAIFQSTNKKVITVTKKGMIRAKKAGKASIKIRSKNAKKCNVRLQVRVYGKFTKAKKVSVKPKQLLLKAGEERKITVSLSPKKATVKKVIWKSSDKKIANVDKTGKITAKKAGNVKVTAYAADGRGAKAVCSVTVAEKGKEEETTPAVHSTNPEIRPTGSAAHNPQTQNPQTKEPQPQESDRVVLADETQCLSLYVDGKAKDSEGIQLVAKSFAEDVALVSESGQKPQIITENPKSEGTMLIAGSVGNNELIDSLAAQGKIDISDISGKRECYRIQVVEQPTEQIERAIVVAGSDKRGTIYGIYHISELIGVSPWVYWGDAVPEKKSTITLSSADLTVTSKEPSVKYRGIFLNDEAPSLTGWVKEKFGNYNEDFYELVYQLILRCKGNYLWPAMWSNSFSEDGKQAPEANAELADKYGIVMGTSHHEPMCRAGVEWQRSYKKYGSSNAWDFMKNQQAITDFWKGGIERNKSYENVYTLGMRGESDSALGGSVEDNINLLKNVIMTQKNILKENALSDAPQVLTVYKEVEDYWYGTEETAGLKDWSELDDVTIMLCDDNFGNMRTLPTGEDIKRPGGWGMYYHFDYHGGPTSYEWVNTVELGKVWEQMTMAYEHGIDDIWIVNVGDLKPMEMNISYFLDLAYDYDAWGEKGESKIEQYRAQWVRQQFGRSMSEDTVQEITSLLKEYTWLNGSCKPEVLYNGTYSVTNYNEAENVLTRIQAMIEKAEKVKKEIPASLQAAYYQLVYYPVAASANVGEMQIYSGFNNQYYELGSTAANVYAKLVKKTIARDKELQDEYNNNMPGVGNKWKNMMSSPHVGYVAWNSEGWSYPEVKYTAPEGDGAAMLVELENNSNVYSKGKCALDDFHDISQESQRIRLLCGEGSAFHYEVQTSDDWITVSKKSGYVTTIDSLDVSIDWSRVSEDKTGTIVIKADDNTVSIAVTAKCHNIQNLEEKTYVYANGYASMLAGNYSRLVSGKDGASFRTIENYGKMGQSIKAFPTTVSFAEDVKQAPYAEYQVQVPKDGEYKLTVYTAPSNNIDRTQVSLRRGIGVGDGEIQLVDSIDSNYIGGTSNDWSNTVKANGHKKEVTISLKEGVNTIRYYAVDPAVVLQKLVISEQSVKSSHLGPQESYYVGKTVKATQNRTAITDTLYSIPGNIDLQQCAAKEGDSYSYPAVVGKAETYEIGLEAMAETEAVAKLYWNNTDLGSITIGTEKKVYLLEKDVTAVQEEGTLRVEITSGEACLYQIVSSVKDTTQKEPVTITASSGVEGHEPDYAFDGKNKTSWKAAETDQSWIAFDFGAEYYIDRYSIRQKGETETHYQFQILENGEWKTVSEKESVEDNKIIFLQGKTPVKAQKVRFVFTGDQVEISEIRLTPYDNWTLSGSNTITVKKKDGSDYPIEEAVASAITDGDRITNAMQAEMGSSSDKSRHSVTIKMDQKQSVDTVRVITSQAEECAEPGSGSIPDLDMTSEKAQYSYRVLYQDEAGTWKEIGTTVKSGSGYSKVFNEFTLKQPVQTDAVKIEIYTSYWVRLVECEIAKSHKFSPFVSE